MRRVGDEEDGGWHILPVSAQAGYLLKFWRKGGWNYADDKRGVGKLRTARDKNTSQILGAHRAKVLLASEEMVSQPSDGVIVLFKRPRRPNIGT